MVAPIGAMTEIISELNALTAAASAPADLHAGTTAGAAAPTGAASFSGLLSAAVNRLDGDVAAANAKARGFASGSEDIPLSDVMLSLEQASLGLQMAANVRDKVVAAYSNIMSMPL